MTITMKQVPKSSNVHAYGYDPATKTLRVAFKSGTYDYAGVPSEVVAALDEAKSKGSFIATSIKGKFSSTKFQKDKPMPTEAETATAEAPEKKDDAVTQPAQAADQAATSDALAAHAAKTDDPAAPPQGGVEEANEAGTMDAGAAATLDGPEAVAGGSAESVAGPSASTPDVQAQETDGASEAIQPPAPAPEAGLVDSADDPASDTDSADEHAASDDKLELPPPPPKPIDLTDAEWAEVLRERGYP